MAAATVTATLPGPQAVLDFWFGAGQAVDNRWFKGGPDFDALIASLHGDTLAAALAGQLAHWPAQGAAGTLALIVVLDQFTRNVHRGTPQAFAGDEQALALTQALVVGGEDRAMPPLQRWFAYMPLEHAEDPPVQAQSVGCFEQLVADAQGSPEHAALVGALTGALDYARQHQAVVDRFGRFPHRNAILGRESTPEEVAFLQQPGSRF